MTQLNTTLRQLRLSGLLQTLDVRLQEAAAGKGKGELMLEPDAASLITTALSVGVGFNVQAVTTITAFAPK